MEVVRGAGSDHGLVAALEVIRYGQERATRLLAGEVRPPWVTPAERTPRGALAQHGRGQPQAKGCDRCRKNVHVPPIGRAAWLAGLDIEDTL